MSGALLAALVALALAIVVVRRRSAAVALLAAQSLLLGALALDEAAGASGELLLAGVVLCARAVVLPAILGRVVAATREPRRVASEPVALGRLVLAVAVAVAVLALVPDLGLYDAGAGRAAVVLVALGIAIAATRRPVVFQAVGFLVAENGVYLACLAVEGGLPGVLELGVLFDLLVIVGVVAFLGTRIHDRFGSGDTSRLESLRD